MVAWLNGSFCTAENLTIGTADLALLRGYGAFDFFRCHNGKTLFLPQHLQRFYKSAQALHLEVPLSLAALETTVLELVAQQPQTSFGVKILITGGYSSDGFCAAAPNLMLLPQPMNALPDTMGGGIALMSYDFQRELPNIKTTNYLTAIWLQPQLKLMGADDVIYYHDGLVTECPRANLFMVSKAGVLITPYRRILNGITKANLLKLAPEIIETQLADISLDDLKTAQEVFITSTTKRILPVLKIDEATIGSGQPCEASTALYHLLRRHELRQNS